MYMNDNSILAMIYMTWFPCSVILNSTNE